jgi:predicted GIY-YIG superfamily endonuclease
MTLLQAMANNFYGGLVMAEVDKVSVAGASGQKYEFSVYHWGQQFKQVGGVYLVLKRRISDYEILYIGQTGDLSERFDDHHKQGCFNRNARTHIGVRVENSEAARLAIERDLLGNYKTACNF